MEDIFLYSLDASVQLSFTLEKWTTNDGSCQIGFQLNRYVALPNPASSGEHPFRGSAWRRQSREAEVLPLNGCQLEEAVGGQCQTPVRPKYKLTKLLVWWFMPISSYSTKYLHLLNLNFIAGNFIVFNLQFSHICFSASLV